MAGIPKGFRRRPALPKPKVGEGKVLGTSVSRADSLAPSADPKKDYLAGAATLGIGWGGWGGWGGFGGYGYGYSGMTLGGGPGGLNVLPQAADPYAAQFGPGVYLSMTRDPAVASSLNYVKQSVMAGGVHLTTAIESDPDADPETGEDDDVEQARDTLEFCQRALGRLPEGGKIEDVGMELLEGLVPGHKIAEITYAVGDDDEDTGLLTLGSLIPKPGESYAWVQDNHAKTVGVLSQAWLPPSGDPAETDSGASSEAAAVLGGFAFLPPEKFLVFRWNPKNADPRGRSILEPAWSPWNSKIRWLPYLDRFVQAQANPKAVVTAIENPPPTLTVGVAGGGTTELPYYTALNQAAATIGTSEYVILPFGATLSLVEPRGDGSAIRDAIDWADRQIGMAIQGASRATQEAGKGGTKADAEAGQDVAQLPVNVAQRTLGEAIYGMLRNLVAANKGLAYATKFTPHVSVGGEAHQDDAANLTAAAAVGYTVDETQMPRLDQKYRMPIRKPKSPEQIAQEQALAAKTAPEPGQNSPPLPGGKIEPASKDNQDGDKS